MEILNDRKYSPKHTWAKLDGEYAYIGVTDFAQDQLGEVLYVDVPDVEDELTKLGIEARGKEGYDSQVWVLLDYGDVMVHIINEENRDFYNLEKLWKDAPYVDVDNLA